MKHSRKPACIVLAAAMLLCCAAPAGASDIVQGTPIMVDPGPYPIAASTYTSCIGSREKATVELLQDGSPVPPESYVATGQVLRSTAAEGAYALAREVVVYGDVLGTGQITLAQLTRLAGAVSGKDPLKGPYLLAADLDASGSVSLTDLTILTKEFLEKDQDAALETTTRNVEVHTYPGTSYAEESVMDLLVVEDADDIPHMSVDELHRLVMMTVGDLTGPIDMIRNETGGLVVLRHASNGAVCTIDAHHDAITFSDYNQFFQSIGSPTTLDFIQEGLPGGEKVQYLSRPAGSFERRGFPLYVDAGDYDINLVCKNGTVYLPVQTVSDIFTSLNMVSLLYNGNSLIINVGDHLNRETKELYYGSAKPSGARSQALAQFTYNEMCMAMDLFYGLKEQHNIQSFDALCVQTGLKARLLSTDPVIADKAVYELTEGYLGDVHTCFRSPSWYAGENADVTSDNISSARRTVLADSEKFEAARKKYFPDGCPSYQEVGNTAYVTFDTFNLIEHDYYETSPTAESTDTIGIVMYAHSRIMRENSPIENVVLDLSVNSGGSADTAVFVLAWYLGGQATLDVNFTATGAQASTVYAADVNADGVCDEKDTLESKNLFCLASGASFSAANLVPCYLKASDSVTLLGQRTAGGACNVLPLSMADGTFVRVSGPFRLSTMMNGSYYDIDRGAPPDYPITSINHFYDRELLTEYINTHIVR